MMLIIMELNMIKLKNLKQLSTLQEQVLSILTESFHDETETQQAWDELQCELWFLTSISDS